MCALTLAPEEIADWITFALVLQLNRRLNLLNVVVKGVLQKSLRSQAVERKVLASQLVPNEILEVMNNSTKGRRVEEHDKAQKKSGYPVADSLANASSAIRRLGNGCKQHHRRARRPWLGCDIVRQQGFCDPRSPACRSGQGV
jgi:hypothetical protein